MSIEVMKFALGALEDIFGKNKVDVGAITALRQAIEQAEKQKPVAWLHRMDNTEGIKSNGKGIVLIDQYCRHPFGKPGVDFDKSYPVTSTPLYTSAQQKPWIGLTDEEVEKIVDDNTQDDQGYDIWCSVKGVAEGVEAKLKELNNERK